MPNLTVEQLRSFHQFIMQQIGPYTLVRRIASGGMAEVWMGRRQALGGASKTVAIKLLASHLAENPIYRRMFVDEARLTMMLTHSNVVQVFDVGEQGGRSYLIMEWVDGLDLTRLGDALRETDEQLDFPVIAHVIGEVLRGLAYAHELLDGDHQSGIVHRDISPHNVLCSVSGEVKIADFGVARLTSEETSGVHVRGKLRYMPPEQVRGDSKHPTVDLFAVGAMLQELLDGVRFRAGIERDELFAMVLRGQVPPLRRREVPAELALLRRRLLTADRGARIQSATEALELLRSWPGYRNAADELAALVRARAGVAAPRSGLAVECSDEQLELTAAPTRIERTVERGSSLLETRAAQRGGQASDTTPSVPDSAPTQVVKQVARGRLPVALGMAIACVGIVLGFGYSWLDRPAQADAATLPEPAVVAAPPVAVAPPSEPPARPQQSEDLLVIEDDPPREQSSKPKAKARASAKVEVAAHEFFFVWVKIGGRELALEPTARLSLKPGKHQVQLRESADRPWRSAGRIEVEAGKRYRVSLRKPAALSLERLD
ncbi:MAG TPA: serine/threonine-protein kinase [Enhygromyxa sp.]|nr:serine/threonine-protein kinase [Enhygromyxa sp.]